MTSLHPPNSDPSTQEREHDLHGYQKYQRYAATVHFALGEDKVFERAWTHVVSNLKNLDGVSIVSMERVALGSKENAPLRTILSSFHPGYNMHFPVEAVQAMLTSYSSTTGIAETFETMRCACVASHTVLKSLCLHGNFFKVQSGNTRSFRMSIQSFIERCSSTLKTLELRNTCLLHWIPFPIDTETQLQFSALKTLRLERVSLHHMIFRESLRLMPCLSFLYLDWVNISCSMPHDWSGFCLLLRQTWKTTNVRLERLWVGHWVVCVQDTSLHDDDPEMKTLANKLSWYFWGHIEWDEHLENAPLLTEAT